MESLWMRGRLHKQGDAGVGHGPGQTQDAAAHDGIAQVEDGHPKGSVALMLQRGAQETQRGWRKTHTDA